MQEVRLSILEALEEKGELSKSDVARETEESKQNVTENHLPVLEEKGYIEIEEGGWQHTVDITRDGMSQLLRENTGTASPREVDKIGRDGHRFIHRFVVGFPVQNSSMLRDDWRERVVKEVDKSVNYVDEFDQYRFEESRWQFRVSGDFVYVKLLDEIRGEHYRKVKDDAIEEAIRGAQFFQELDEIPIVLDESPASFRIAEQHIGSSGDNLVHAFVKYVDEETEHNVSNWRAYGEEGTEDRELMIWADKSSGQLHEESGNGGNPSGSREKAEDAQAFTEEITEGMISRPDETRELVYNGVERIEGAEEVVQDVKDTQEKHGEVLKEIGEALKTIQGNRESEKSTRDALMELVRSNKQEREEMQERFQERLDRMQESFQTQLERQQEVIEGLSEKVDELEKEEKSLEARVREAYRKDPEYSEVFEHSMNRSLYAWNYSNGRPECEKILDESMRERMEVTAAHG